MSKPAGPSIAIGSQDAVASRFRLSNCSIQVRGDDGKYQWVAVGAELVIDHAGLRRLCQKAHDNRSRRSSDGPLTIHALGRQGAVHDP